jgi:hypothetical protein
MEKEFELPKGAFYIENRYGMRYPKEKGYYGFQVGCQPAYYYWQDCIYTIDVFKEGEYVTTFSCKHGEF